MLDTVDPPDPSPPPVRHRLIAGAPLRQAKPVERITGEPSWWVTAPAGAGFTQRGDTETLKTRHRREASGIGLRPIAE